MKFLIAYLLLALVLGLRGSRLTERSTIWILAVGAFALATGYLSQRVINA